MNGKINNVRQLCSALRVQYLSGREKGIEAFIVNNGRLSFELLVDRALDVNSFYHKGVNIAFSSAGGLNGFDRDFDYAFNGGMLYTCGLDTIGGRSLPVHGRIHNVPAEVIKAVATEEGVEIVGLIKQASLFGEKLQLKRTVRTVVNSDTLEIIDEITNLAHTDGEYCLLYHTNLGYPMLDEGVTLSAPIVSTAPRTEYAAKRVKSCLIMDEPKPDNEETVFYHTVKKGEVTITNKALKKSVLIEYDEKKLPHLIEWKSMVSGAYALGIEPATSTLDDGFIKRPIKAGETIKTGIKITVRDL